MGELAVAPIGCPVRVRILNEKRIVMKRYKLFAAVIAAALLPLAGCKSNQTTAVPPQNPATGSGQSNGVQPGTPNSDGTAAPAPNGAGQAPGPGGQNPAPPPAPVVPPAPEATTAPAGTRVAVRLTETLSARRNEVGDGFSGVLEAPVVYRGTTLFPRGTRVTGTVVAAKGRGRFKGSGDLGIELATIGGVRVHTSEYEKELKGKGKRTGGFIGGGAGLGALIGGLAGGGKGAVIGGLAGAGAGTAGAAYTGNKDVVIPSESIVAFHLSEPVTVTK
jgi:hypothetical protein